jgi:hypothetical protein
MVFKHFIVLSNRKDQVHNKLLDKFSLFWRDYSPFGLS